MPVFLYRKKRILLVVILLVVFYLIGYLFLFTKNHLEELQCDFQDSNKFVDSVCHLYHKNNVTGSICEHLCNSNRIKTSSCLNYNGGKLVLLSDCMDVCVKGRSVHAVLKSEYSKIQDIPDIPFPVDGISSPGFQYRRIVDMLEKFVSGTIKFNSGIGTKDNQSMVAKIWSYTNPLSSHSKSYSTGEIFQLIAAARSIWSLVNQNEYVFTKLHHQNVNFLPVIYGTCGPLYLQEYLPSGSALSRSLTSFNTKNTPWLKRARLAMHIMDLLMVVEEKFHEPIHLCDMKGDNFGVAGRDQVKIIDSDNLFYDSILQNYLQDPNCTRSEDCDFFDCRGQCNVNRKKCERERSNNNLQSVCEKIFLSSFSNLYNGLLHNPPNFIEYSLRKLLDLCAAPDGSRRSKATRDVYNRIYNLLQQSIGL